jgi:hypothetical protein
MVGMKRSLQGISILINAVLLITGYYYLGVIRSEISSISSPSKLSLYETWGSMLYIILVLLLVALIIQVIIYVLKLLAVKLGFES